MPILTFVERLLWAMASIIVLLILAFALLGWAENNTNIPVLSNFATWVNQRARPQAN